MRGTGSEKRTERLTGLILPASFACMLWGSAAPVIKTGYRLLSVTDTRAMTLFAGLRFFLAGLLVILFDSLRGGKLRVPAKSDAGKILLIGVIQTFAQYLFNFIGVGHASGVNASIMNGTGSLIAIVLACTLFRQERFTLRKALGCAFGFGGILVMNLGGGAGGFSLTGEGFLLIAALCGAVGNCTGKIFTKSMEPVMLTGWQFLTGGALLTAVSLLRGGRIAFTSVPGALCLLWLSLVSAAAYCIWMTLYRNNPVSAVSVHGFLIPLFGVLISALLLGEYAQALRPLTLAALCMVCAGIIVVNIRGKNAR